MAVMWLFEAIQWQFGYVCFVSHKT